MIGLLSRRWERANLWQATRAGRVLLGVVAVVFATVAFGPGFLAARSFTQLRDRVATVIAAVDTNAKSPETVELLERGTVTIDGRAIGGDRVKSIIEQAIGEDGKIEPQQEFVAFMLAPEAATWLPVFILERPDAVAVVAAASLGFLLLAVAQGVGLSVAVLLVAGIAAGASFWWLGMAGPMVALAGMGALAAAFLVATRTALALLNRRVVPLAIAHTVMKEAIRQRISTFFIAVVLVVLPLLPLWIDPATPLRYQIQTFLSRSTGLVVSCAALLTILLSCSTTAFEARDRQVWQLLTKPVGRLQYLVGKWLGVISVNAVLLLVSATAAFGYTEYLRTRPAADLRDLQAVRAEVLAARQGVLPSFEQPTRDRLLALIDAEIEADPVLKQDIADGVRNEAEVRSKLAAEKQKEFLARQRAIEPGQGHEYHFDGLHEAIGSETPLSLRFVLHTGDSSSHETHPVIFRFPKDQSWVDRMYVPAQGHEMLVPSSMVDDDGTLRMEIINLKWDGTQFQPGVSTIFFDPDGVEVLYSVGSFEGNFFRAMLVEWVKLAFVAMLGACAGALFSFPVACLSTSVIFVVALMSPFLAMSLEYYYAPSDAPWVLKLFHAIVKGVAQVSQSMLSAFGKTRVTDRLVQGRAVRWSEVAGAVGLIGLGWSALVLLIGYLGLRRKELAMYSGQG